MNRHVLLSFVLVFAVMSFGALAWSQQRSSNPYAQQQQAQLQRQQPQTAARPASAAPSTPAATANPLSAGEGSMHATLPAGARKWEYLVPTFLVFPSLKEQMWAGTIDGVEIPKDAKIDQVMKTAGERGWELVTVLSDPSGVEPRTTTYYFKRPAR